MPRFTNTISHQALIWLIGGMVAVLSTACAASEATNEGHDHSDNAAHAHDDHGNASSMTMTDTQRCFTSNGLPNHATGTFPNRGNPNAIAAQDVKVCVPLSPQKRAKATLIRGTTGIALNGVQFRPTTAGYWDADARRGHSRDGDKNWSVDIHGAPGKLGLDFNNAHVGRGGLYHYHGIASNLSGISGDSLIGYAGDGFEIRYAGDAQQSGWDLKEGIRPTGPGGAYDGTYNEDYVFTGGIGRLDACNGGMKDGEYVYYVTDSYPFVGRCLYGEVSPDFNRARHGGERRSEGQGRGRRDRPRRQDRSD